MPLTPPASEARRTLINGHLVTLEVHCAGALICPTLCLGGNLTIGDVTVRLSCAHADNLIDRVREAIDATVLGTLPLPRPSSTQ